MQSRHHSDRPVALVKQLHKLIYYYNEICQLVKQAPFNVKSDIVVHIRMTDKND